MVAPAKVRRPAISSARFEIDPVDGNDFFGLFVAFSFVEAWLEGCLSLLKLFVVDGFLSSACGLLLSGFGFSSCGLTLLNLLYGDSGMQCNIGLSIDALFSRTLGTEHTDMSPLELGVMSAAGCDLGAPDALTPIG